MYCIALAIPKLLEALVTDKFFNCERTYIIDGQHGFK